MSRKYKLGDRFSHDFDYDGMIEMGLQTNSTWSISDLQKLYDSMEDVNYHTANKYLGSAIFALENDLPDVADIKFEKFHKELNEEENYAKGGSINKRKKYTYIPKEEIESITTWNGNNITQEKILDGAYVRGNVKFAKGGMPLENKIRLRQIENQIKEQEKTIKEFEEDYTEREYDRFGNPSPLTFNQQVVMSAEENLERLQEERKNLLKGKKMSNGGETDSLKIKIEEDGDNYEVNYQFDDYEITGVLQKYYTGRANEYEFQPSWFADEESEKYYDENWENIEDEILNVFYSKFKKGGKVKRSKYGEGGSVEQGNLEMMKNQAIQVKHHADELIEILKSSPRVDAWVVSLMDRATQNLSNITHYLDGELKHFAKGGMAKGETAKSYWNKFDRQKRVDFLVASGYSKSFANDLSLESWDGLEVGVHNDLEWLTTTSYGKKTLEKISLGSISGNSRVDNRR